MRAYASAILALCFCSTLVGCQTTRSVSLAYQDAMFGGERYQASDRTSVLFVVDGLSSEILRTSLENANVPHLADAFTLSTKARFPLGRAVFPSLTFPNMTSILTGTSDAHHPIIGNRVKIEDDIVNFEVTSNWDDLARLIHRQTIFARLASHDISSVSYAFAFSGGATAFQEKSIEAGLGYLQQDYAAIDSGTLDSLKNLLTDTQVAKWPRFIFVHLIGVDALAHRYGPLDPRVQSYLHELDTQLGQIFSILDHPNGLSSVSRDVNYALTADHGFRTTPDHSPLEDVVSRLKKRVRLVADNRSAPMWIDEPMTDLHRIEIAKGLLQVPHVGWAAVKSANTIDLFRRTGQHARISFAEAAPVAGTAISGPSCANGERAANFEWISEEEPSDSNEYASRGPRVFTCLSAFDAATAADDDSYLVPALADYFAAPGAPDIVFIPDDHSDFASGSAGNHGGLTREEMLVPVLTKGVDMPRGIHPTADLLREMGVEP